MKAGWLLGLSRGLVVVVVHALFACASGPDLERKFVKAPNPPPGKGLLYVFRWFDELFDTDVYLNNRPLVRLSTDGYTQVYLEPGRYVISTGPLDQSGERVDFTVEAGGVSAAMLVKSHGSPVLSGFIVGKNMVSPTYRDANKTPSDRAWGHLGDIYATQWFKNLQRQRFQRASASSFKPLD